jgi:hypothetical protein
MERKQPHQIERTSGPGARHGPRLSPVYRGPFTTAFAAKHALRLACTAQTLAIWYPHPVVMMPFIMAVMMMPMIITIVIFRPGGKRDECRNDG